MRDSHQSCNVKGLQVLTPFEANAGFQIQIATIIIPNLGKSAGRFCRFLKCGEGECLGGKEAHFYSQFNNQIPQWLGEPKIIDSDRSDFDFSKKYIEHDSSAHKKLKYLDADFVRFCAEENSDIFIWEFVLSADKIEDIWCSGESKRMQIYTVLFDNNLQLDPTLKVSTATHRNEDLVFRSDYSAFLAYGIITNHIAISIDEYGAKTRHDPVIHYASKVYFDDLNYAGLSAEQDFDTYLQKVRLQLNSPPNLTAKV